MRRCKVCGVDKDDRAFYNGEGKYIKTCRACRNLAQNENRKIHSEKTKEQDRVRYQKTKEQRKQYARDYRAKYPDRTRKTNWKGKYGITAEDYYAKLSSQANRCDICGRSMEDYGKIFCVDHNHNTGRVRGLLCDPCNYGLGFYEKHKDKYKSYLEKHGELCV